MKFPTEPTFWNALTTFLLIVNQILIVYYRKLSRKEHLETQNKVTVVTNKVEEVATQTNGINQGLRNTINQQEIDRVATAKAVAQDAKDALDKK